eukprot:2225686-Rhodomonas_salina.1
MTFHGCGAPIGHMEDLLCMELIGVDAGYLSNIWKISEEGWWMVATTVRPDMARCFSVSHTLVAVYVSSLVYSVVRARQADSASGQ